MASIKTVFDKVKEFTSGNGGLDFMTYDKILENNKEFPRSDMWEVTFLTPPSASYYPGDEIINLRCTDVAPSMPNDTTVQTVNIRGVNLHQPTWSQQNGTLSLTFQDRVDKAITMFVNEWKNACSSPIDFFTFPKESLRAVILITYMNAQRIPISQILCRGCFPSAQGLNETGSSDDPSLTGEVTLDLMCEHMKRTILTY